MYVVFVLYVWYVLYVELATAAIAIENALWTKFMHKHVFRG